MRDASIVKDDLLDLSKEHTLVEPFLEEAPYEESCGGGVMTGVTPSIEQIDRICTKSFVYSPFNPPCFPPSPLICMFSCVLR